MREKERWLLGVVWGCFRVRKGSTMSMWRFLPLRVVILAARVFGAYLTNHPWFVFFYSYIHSRLSTWSAHPYTHHVYLISLSISYVSFIFIYLLVFCVQIWSKHRLFDVKHTWNLRSTCLAWSRSAHDAPSHAHTCVLCLTVPGPAASSSALSHRYACVFVYEYICATPCVHLLSFLSF